MLWKKARNFSRVPKAYDPLVLHPCLSVYHVHTRYNPVENISSTEMFLQKIVRIVPRVRQREESEGLFVPPIVNQHDFQLIPAQCT